MKSVTGGTSLFFNASPPASPPASPKAQTSVSTTDNTEKWREERRHPDLQNWTLRLYRVEPECKNNVSAGGKPTEEETEMDKARYRFIETAKRLGAPNYLHRVENGRYLAAGKSIFYVNDKPFTLQQIESASWQHNEKLIIAQQYYDEVCRAKERACNRHQANPTMEHKEAMLYAWQVWDEARKALKALETQANIWRQMREVEISKDPGKASSLMHHPQLLKRFCLPYYDGPRTVTCTVRPEPKCKLSSALDDYLLNDDTR